MPLRIPVSMRLAGCVFVLALLPAHVGSAADGQLRCGWFDNSSPGNASLFDKDGEWTIAMQGEHQAKGTWPPKFAPGQLVKTGGASYGYGCACLKMAVDSAAKQVNEIFSAKGVPLSVCRKDRSIAAVEKTLR